MKSTAIVGCKYTEYYDNPTVIVSFFIRRTDFFFVSLFVAFSRNGNPPFLYIIRQGGFTTDITLLADNEFPSRGHPTPFLYTNAYKANAHLEIFAGCRGAHFQKYREHQKPLDE